MDQTRHILPRSARITDRRDFQQIFAARCSEADELLIIYASANGLAQARLGLSVSKRLGPAVNRNRYKRLLREAFRTTQHELPAGFDYVLIARAGLAGQPASLEQYRQSLPRLASRAARRCRVRADTADNHVPPKP